ncbi:hypothetical protein IFM89_015126, partial [Coptis chinensis]
MWMCGCVDESYRVFRQISFKDIVSYNGMISGFANHGHVEYALKRFEELLTSGLQSDQITFCVLTACSLQPCREKHVEEACDRGRNMEVQPHVGVWGALLAASGVLGFTTMLKLAKLLQRSFSLWSLRIVGCSRIHELWMVPRLGVRLFRSNTSK